MIVGRAPELTEIAAVLEAARNGAGASLCLVGEPGIGKTTLLDAAGSAAGFQVLRATGVPAELSLGHGALLALLLPLRDRLDAVPGPQRDALAAALGWAGPGGDGDRFLVAAGALSLLAAAAERQPVLVAVDDAQWIDRESLAVLAFVARRLGHDPVALLVAARADPDSPAAMDGVRSLALGGLPVADAAVLLRGRVAAGLVDPLVVATGGNPLALVEAVRRLTPEQRRGSAPLPDVLPLGDRLASAFRRDGDALPAGAHRALVLAAASGEPEAGPVVAALRAEGQDSAAALTAAERAGGRAGGRPAHVHPPAAALGGLVDDARRRAPVGARRAGRRAGRGPGPADPAPGRGGRRVRRRPGRPPGGAGRPGADPPRLRRRLRGGRAGRRAAPRPGPGRVRPGGRGGGRAARRRSGPGPRAGRAGAGRSGRRPVPSPGAARPRHTGALRGRTGAGPAAAGRGRRGGLRRRPAAGAGRAVHGGLPARLGRGDGRRGRRAGRRRRLGRPGAGDARPLHQGRRARVRR